MIFKLCFIFSRLSASLSYKVLTKQPYKISIWTFSKFSKLFYKIYFSNDSAIPTEFQFRGAPVNLYLYV